MAGTTRLSFDDLYRSQVPQPDVYARPSMEDYYNPATLVNTPVNPPMDYYQASASPLDTLRAAGNVFNPFSNNSVWGTAYTPETADQLPVYYDFNQLGLPKWANDAFWSEAYRPSNYFTLGTSGLARGGLNAARNVAENTLGNIGLEGLNKALPENVAIPLETVGGLAMAGRAGYKGIKAGINELRDESRLTARAAETAGKEAAEVAKQFENFDATVTKTHQIDFSNPNEIRRIVSDSYVTNKSISDPTPEKINAQTFYHGSPTTGITKKALTSNEASDYSLFGPGLYMSNDPLGAPISFARQRGPLYESRVNVKNVLDLDADINLNDLGNIRNLLDEKLKDNQLDDWDGYNAALSLVTNLYWVIDDHRTSPTWSDNLPKTNAQLWSGLSGYINPRELNQLLSGEYDAFTHRSSDVAGGNNTSLTRLAPNTNQVLILLEPQNKPNTVLAFRERPREQVLPEIGAIQNPTVNNYFDTPEEKIRYVGDKINTEKAAAEVSDRKEKFVNFVESSIIPAIRKASQGKPLSENNLDSLANELKSFYTVFDPSTNSLDLRPQNGIEPYMSWVYNMVRGFNNEQGNGFSMFRDQEFAQQILRELYRGLNDYKPQSRLEKLRSRLGK